MRIRFIVRVVVWLEDMFLELVVLFLFGGSGRKDVVIVVLLRFVEMCVGVGFFVWRVVCVEVIGLFFGLVCIV